MPKDISPQDIDMLDDLYQATLASHSRKHSYVIWAVAVFCCLFFIWAAISKLDQVTSGTGKVIPSSQVQLIQSLDGGILEALYVNEGEIVTKGQALARIDDTRFVSDFAQQEQEVNSLSANIIRLSTEIDSIVIQNNEKPKLAAKNNWQAAITIQTKALVFSEHLHRFQPELINRQNTEYQSRLQKLSNKLDILASQIVQKQQDKAELLTEIATFTQSHQLISKELALTLPLTKNGIVPEVELLKLERKVNDINGQLRGLKLKQPKLDATINEAILKRREAALIFIADAQAELNELQTRLSRMKEAQVSAKDKVNKAIISSPVTGTIKTLHITTIGGVVEPGEDIIEIVPSEDQLLIETHIAPKDIAFLHPGLPAVVKVTAYDFTRYGGLNGTVEHISADTRVDEQGNSFYLIKVRTKEASLIKKDGSLMPIIPGMLTAVDIVTGERSILDYLLNPILRAKDTALRER